MIFDLAATTERRRVFRDRVAISLRKFLKKDNTKILQKQLAAYLGIGERTVQGWLYGEHGPDDFQVGLLVKILGPDFLKEIYGEFLNDFKRNIGRKRIN